MQAEAWAAALHCSAFAHSLHGTVLAVSVCSAAAEVAVATFIFVSGYARGMRVRSLMGISGVIFSSRECLFRGGARPGRIVGVCWAGACACGLRARVGAVFAVAGCVMMVERQVVSCGLGYRAVVLCSRCAWLARSCAPESVCSVSSRARRWGRARVCLRRRGCVRCSCAGGRLPVHLPSLKLWKSSYGLHKDYSHTAQQRRHRRGCRPRTLGGEGD